ncbi:tRNA-modifying protein YgfZ [Rheinheimera sp.]|uniref:tRNA-modifying protein YgfZ n=1 Tax=Rheinheimera sp. TaxID=1869214 RepID=UPI0027BAFA5A|nr:tRNA-modifying protein YgfZ [Rheinheimera sp.]
MNIEDLEAISAMQSSWISAEQLAQLSNDAEQAFISPLPAFHVIRISGPDQKKYLQGQTTCDINTLTENNFLRGAHCDAKGKMWATFHLWQAGDDLLYAGFRDEIQASLVQLKKFGVFSKVSFHDTQDQLAVLGVSGPQADSLLATLGWTVPERGQLVAVPGGQLMALAPQHYLLVLDIAAAKQLITAQPGLLAAPTRFLAQHIQHGLPYLEQALIGEYVPQNLNLQAIDAISFSKGCYIGQEMVARMKYLGKNKRATYILKAQSAETPAAGSDIEVQLEQNWRRSGVVVNAVNIHGELFVLAVLPNDTASDAHLRLASAPDTLFRLEALPYSLN